MQCTYILKHNVIPHKYTSFSMSLIKPTDKHCYLGRRMDPSRYWSSRDSKRETVIPRENVVCILVVPEASWY